MRTSTCSTAKREDESATAKPKEPGLDIGLALDFQDLAQAYSLIHKQYLRYGFVQPHPSGKHVTRWDLLPETYTIVGKQQGRLVATLSLVKDSSEGVPSDENAGAELDALRAEGRKLCEVSSDAVLEAHGDPYTVIHMYVFSVKLAREFLGVTDYVITANPRHIKFFRRLLCFEQLAEARGCERVSGAPGVALRLNLETMPDVYRSRHGHRVGIRNYYRTFFVDGQEALQARVQHDLARYRRRSRRDLAECFSDWGCLPEGLDLERPSRASRAPLMPAFAAHP